MNYEQSERKQAEHIIASARRYIVQRRGTFLDALYALQFSAVDDLPTVMTTDGLFIYYSPKFLIQFYEHEGNDGIESVAYGILHLCSHCLLGHLPSREQVDDLPLFDVIADYKVHKLLSVLWHGKKYSKKYRKLPDNIALDYTNYPLLLSYKKLSKKQSSAEKYLKYAQQICVDDHELWKRQFSEEGLLEGESEEQGKDGKGKEGSGEKRTQKLPTKRISSEQRQAMNQWKKTMQKMMQENPDLQECMGEAGAGMSAGDGDGIASWLYDDLEESETDYSKVLEEFLRRSAVEVENIDEIDPMWYHFGLDYLEDIPIIEPTEEVERPAEGTLVIAIDTSGSCQYSVCDRFLSELDNLMTQLEVMESVNHVVLYQCDDEIQEELRIDDVSDWKNMVEQFILKGGGGTDFRPVFQASEEFEDMVGLIYLSDCEGYFPEEQPDYPTLFLVTGEEDSWGAQYYTVPDWVQTVDFSV